MSIPCGTRFGGAEVEAIFLQAAAVVVGLAILVLAYWKARTASRSRDQHGPGGPHQSKTVAFVLLALGLGVVGGGILYAQMRLEDQIQQIKEEEKRLKNPKGGNE
jgi:hypothetical protein